MRKNVPKKNIHDDFICHLINHDAYRPNIFFGTADIEAYLSPLIDFDMMNDMRRGKVNNLEGNPVLDMYAVTVSTVSDQTLEDLSAQLPLQYVVLIEDIDAAKRVLS